MIDALLLAQTSPLGIFDALTFVVAVASYAIGRKRGLVWQLSGVATLLVGGACATILARPLGGLFAEGIVGRFAAWVTIYALVAICLYVLSLKLKHRIEKLEFDELDQRFGGLLGVFKGLFAFAILTLVAAGLSTGVALAVRESASGRALLVIVDELRPVVPERIADALFPAAEATPLPTPAPSDPLEQPVYQPELQPEPQPTTQQRPRRPERPRTSPPKPAPREPEPEPERDPEPEQFGPQRADPGYADPFDTRRDPVDPLAPPR